MYIYTCILYSNTSKNDNKVLMFTAQAQVAYR